MNVNTIDDELAHEILECIEKENLKPEEVAMKLDVPQEIVNRVIADHQDHFINVVPAAKKYEKLSYRDHLKLAYYNSLSLIEIATERYRFGSDAKDSKSFKDLVQTAQSLLSDIQKLKDPTDELNILDHEFIQPFITHIIKFMGSRLQAIQKIDIENTELEEACKKAIREVGINITEEYKGLKNKLALHLGASQLEDDENVIPFDKAKKNAE